MMADVSTADLARNGFDAEDSLPIATGLEPNEVECSPCLSLTDKAAHLSFIGTIGHGTGPLRHRLYRMSGPDPARLGPAELVCDEHCYCGFWRPDLTVIGEGDGFLRLLFADGEVRQIDTGFSRIGRVSYRADFPHHLLVTGGDALAGWNVPTPMRTLVYDVDDEKVVGEITVDGGPTYKPGLYGALLLLPEEVPGAHRAWRLDADRQPQLASSSRRFHRLR